MSLLPGVCFERVQEVVALRKSSRRPKTFGFRPLTILLMSAAKVTPLLGLSWEPPLLLLPPSEFLLMMPAGRGRGIKHDITVSKYL